MKWLIYIGILLWIGLAPLQGSDVGELIPVEVIAVAEADGSITVETDTGDMGYGASLDEAFADLKETAPGVIYLDTAEYLILEEGLQISLAQLCPYLKDDVRVYRGRGELTLEGIAAYLDVHGKSVEMAEAVKGARIPVLREEKGRYHVGEK